MRRWGTGLFDDDSSLDAFAMYHTNPNGAEYFDEVIDRLYVIEFLDLDDCADFLVGLNLYLNYLKEDSVEILGDYQVDFGNCRRRCCFSSSKWWSIYSCNSSSS